MARWLSANITGCIFATHFAASLQPHIVRDRAVEDPLPHDLSPRIDACVKKGVVAMFLFPTMRTPKDIARLLAVLDKHEDWTLSSPAWPQHPRPEDILLRLEYRTKGEKLSTPIGFAPLGSMPVLRRSPYVALALWPGESSNPHKPGGKSRVSLADTKFTAADISKAKYERWFEESTRNKASHLEGQQEGAADHAVTFCLPREEGVISTLRERLTSL